MDFYDSKILETLKSFKSPEEATKYVNNLFDQIYYYGSYLPLDNDIYNQKTFKMVEDIIEYSIQTNNTDILYDVDDFVFGLFCHKNNYEYLFNSDYIIWCKYTYECILGNFKYNKKHEERKIDPRFYTDRDVEWFYRNYKVLENIPYEDIRISDIITDYSFMFEDKDFVKFLYNVDYNILYKNIVNDIENFNSLLESFKEEEEEEEE